MEPCIEFIGALQNSGSWLVKVEELAQVAHMRAGESQGTLKHGKGPKNGPARGCS